MLSGFRARSRVAVGSAARAAPRATRGRPSMLSAPATAAEALRKVRRFVGTVVLLRRASGGIWAGIMRLSVAQHALLFTDWTARPRRRPCTETVSADAGKLVAPA